MLPKTQQRGCQVVPMFSSILKVLVVGGTLTLAHAFLTKDVNSIIAICKNVLFVVIL